MSLNIFAPNTKSAAFLKPQLYSPLSSYKWAVQTSPAFPRAEKASHHKGTFRRVVVAKVSNISRRVALNRFSLLLSSCLLSALPLDPANADRTGKYSTKLTAKRRYLPRISKGFKLLQLANPQVAADWIPAVGNFDDAKDDLFSALSLFGTSYFAEGNRIGQTEKALKVCVEQLESASEKLSKAAKIRDFEAAKIAYSECNSAAECYMNNSKLREISPTIPF